MGSQNGLNRPRPWSFLCALEIKTYESIKKKKWFGMEENLGVASILISMLNSGDSDMI